MNRIRTWLIRWLQGEAKSQPPIGVSEHLPHDHPRRGQPDGAHGPNTHVALIKFQVQNLLPKIPDYLQWRIYYSGDGYFCVEIQERGGEQRYVASREELMRYLSDKHVLTLARTITHQLGIEP